MTTYNGTLTKKMRNRYGVGHFTQMSGLWASSNMDILDRGSTL